MGFVELIVTFVNFFIHLDVYLNIIIDNYGALVYVILFLIIFLETGFVVTPFLPGDSLLFAAGTFAAIGSLNIVLLFILLVIAAIIGDSVNYWIGSLVGPKVFKKKSKFFKQEYLLKTQSFYERHGKATIIIARFIPIVRTFAPFVAGISKMNYKKFLSYNVAGGLLWVFLFTFGGYFFGNIPLVKENFSLVILVIIILSILPGFIEYFRAKHQYPK